MQILIILSLATLCIYFASVLNHRYKSEAAIIAALLELSDAERALIKKLNASAQLKPDDISAEEVRIVWELCEKEWAMRLRDGSFVAIGKGEYLQKRLNVGYYNPANV